MIYDIGRLKDYDLLNPNNNSGSVEGEMLMLYTEIASKYGLIDLRQNPHRLAPVFIKFFQNENAVFSYWNNGLALDRKMPGRERISDQDYKNTFGFIPGYEHNMFDKGMPGKVGTTFPSAVQKSIARGPVRDWFSYHTASSRKNRSGRLIPSPPDRTDFVENAPQ